MSLRITILSIIAFACATELAVAGPLPSDFGQKLILGAIAVVAIYLIYPITLGIALVLWRRGRRRVAGGLVAMLLLVGVAFPLVHQRAYFANHAQIAEATIVPEAIDLSGKTVLVVAQHCHDLCEAMLTHANLDALYQIALGFREDRDFIKTGLVPSKGRLARLSLQNGRAMRHEATRSDLSKVDYVIYKDLYSTIDDTLAARIAPDMPMNDIGIGYLFAPVDDIETATTADLEPDLLAFSYGAKTFRAPLHPATQFHVPIFGYSEKDAALGRLLCPEPDKRLHRVCSPKRMDTS